MARDVRPRLASLTRTPEPDGGLAAAVGRAVGFLVGWRDSDGLWSDFETYAGRSTEWVSGFVVTLAGELPGAWAACRDAAEALGRRQGATGGWGYNRRIPDDADSTAWVLRGLAAGPALSPHAVRAARAFLGRHLRPDGGFATYHDLAAIGAVIGESDLDRLAGWGSSHGCVTANVVLALLESGVPPRSLAPALDFLERARDRDGLWRSYWWSGPELATYWTMAALTTAGRLPPGERERSARALARLAPSAALDGGSAVHPFAVAHLVLALLLAPPDPDLDARAAAAVRWLLGRQLADGSWPTVPILRIPDAHVVDPDAPASGGAAALRPGTGVTVPDDRRLFTTAVAAAALERYRTTAALRRTAVEEAAA